MKSKEPGEIYWQLVDQVWDSISIYDGPEIFLNQFSTIPRYVGYLFAAHWCQSEVRNGGFFQFFENSTGVLAPEAVAGFKEIGMTQCAAIIEKAMLLFGSVYPRDREIRTEALVSYEDDYDENGSDPFDKLDNQFYDLIDEENGGFDNAADAYAKQFTNN